MLEYLSIVREGLILTRGTLSENKTQMEICFELDL